MIVIGTRLFGKVDVVPGVGHVATKFFHIDYAPLIPSGSVLVLSQSGRRWNGLPVPLSLKSIVVAWLRAGTFLGMVIGIIGIIMMFASRVDQGAEVMVGIGAVCAVAFTISYQMPLFKQASWERACELGKIVGLDDAGWQKLGAAYGRVVPRGGVSHGFPLGKVRAAIPIESSQR